VTPPNDTAHLTARLETADCARGFISTTALVAGAGGPTAS